MRCAAGKPLACILERLTVMLGIGHWSTHAVNCAIYRLAMLATNPQIKAAGIKLE